MELKLDSSPYQVEVFGEENGESFPILIKIPYCELDDRITFVLRQIKEAPRVKVKRDQGRNSILET